MDQLPGLPDSYIDDMPCDSALLVELGRVTWAAARLHAGVRDAINRLDGVASDKPFTTTLGEAITILRKRATGERREDIVQWVDDVGRPAARARNKVAHAVAYTADDGLQALRTDDHSPPGRFTVANLRDVTRALIAASMRLPRT